MTGKGMSGWCTASYDIGYDAAPSVVLAWPVRRAESPQQSYSRILILHNFLKMIIIDDRCYNVMSTVSLIHLPEPLSLRCQSQHSIHV